MSAKSFLEASVLFVLFASCSAFAQTKSPVEGVWKITEWVLPGRDPADEGATITNPETGVVIFTRGHYSQLVVRGEQPRAAVAPAKDPQNLTDAEKFARYEHWRPVTANSGTYEVKGSTLVIRVLVAKNVDVSARGAELTFRFDGPNTLWLIPPAQSAAREPLTKLTRLE
jgi:hypothetical protein